MKSLNSVKGRNHTRASVASHRPVLSHHPGTIFSSLLRGLTRCLPDSESLTKDSWRSWRQGLCRLVCRRSQPPAKFGECSIYSPVDAGEWNAIRSELLERSGQALRGMNRPVGGAGSLPAGASHVMLASRPPVNADRPASPSLSHRQRRLHNNSHVPSARRCDNDHRVDRPPVLLKSVRRCLRWSYHDLYVSIT